MATWNSTSKRHNCTPFLHANVYKSICAVVKTSFQLTCNSVLSFVFVCDSVCVTGGGLCFYTGAGCGCPQSVPHAAAAGSQDPSQRNLLSPHYHVQSIRDNTSGTHNIIHTMYAIFLDFQCVYNVCNFI